MVMVERDPAGEETAGAEDAGELGTPAADDLLVAYDGVKVVAGVGGTTTAEVLLKTTLEVMTGNEVVDTTVERAGQLVTEAAQLVMVTSLVEYTMDSDPAMTAVAMKAAAAATVNCILKIYKG
eukprot:TRINITY_DN30766_c0_g1_i1.p2 TRINITY_DN30766_c0_g1~~TRINITY_DN30766_c0_g1_i1.p2  ORF type:complete len:123 (-),score=23.39 TRINITY_DN30766_c0_g1_i1:161-529(-)